MKFKQKVIFYAVSAILAVPLFAAALTPQTAMAYKCTGQTNNMQHYYRDGACYQPVGNTCLDNPPPSDISDCQNRDTSQDTRVADEKPVKNDGSEVTEWTCASGTYNQQNHACETCNAFGNCQTNTNVRPIPSGADDTVDSDTQGGSNNEDDGTERGGQGECAGEKTDFLACDGDGADAIVSVLRIIILIVSIGVGAVAVGGLVFGAILYASAQDSQDQIRKAIVVIRSVVVGVLLYVFMVTILNFLVPGGVFSGGSNPECTTEQTGISNENENNADNSNDETENNNQNPNNEDENAQDNQNEENQQPAECAPEETDASSEENSNDETENNNQNPNNEDENNNNQNN